MNGFSQNNNEAASRFKEYQSKDPFPDIPPALLNSADIEDYARETGMIYPFEPKDLKSGSYEVRLGGKGDKFPLRPNSIAFVTPEPIFRLPDYIALRFNLRIKNVHRGLLLGTGPLIDPGFEGQLLIPLHNLTRNEYTFEYGEGLIWVEFTKLSPYKDWAQVSEKKDRSGKYVVFPENKKHLPPEYYLSKALEGHSSSTIQSSLPDIILSARHSAQESEKAAGAAAKSAKDTADKAASTRSRITAGVIIAVAAVVIALIALAIQVYTLTQDAISYVRQNSQILNEEKERLQALEKEVQNLKQRVGDLTKPSVPALGSMPPSTGTMKKDAKRNK